MHIFFLAQRVPFPPNRGDKITTYNEVRHLAKTHTVEVFCLAEDRADIDNARGLQGIAQRVHVVPLRKIAARARALGAIASGKALSVEYFNERRLHRIVTERFAEAAPDLVFVYSSGMAQFAEGLPTRPKIMQFGDMDSLKWEQYARLAKFPKKLLYTLETKRLLDYERRIARTFSHSIVYTERELRDFNRLIPGASVSCVGNGVDMEHFSPGDAQKKANSLIFTGVMDYFPNIDAVQWFCERVMPMVKRDIGEVHLTICGSRPTREVHRLAANGSVTVTGWVPETVPYLRQAEVAIAPLRLGRGIQNKVLEAMAAGLPCVASPLAFEGIMAEPGPDALVADDPTAFAQCVIRLLKDPDERRRIGANARRAIETNYSWDTHLASLDRTIARVVSGTTLA